MALPMVDSSRMATMEQIGLSDGYKTDNGFLHSMASPFTPFPSYSIAPSHHSTQTSTSVLAVLLKTPIRFVPATDLTREDEMARTLRSRYRRQNLREAAKRQMCRPYSAVGNYRIKTPRPFPNENSKCYRNAAVQALLHVPKLVSWLGEGHTHPPNEPLAGEEPCVTCALKKLALAYWDIIPGSNQQCVSLLNTLHSLLVDGGWPRRGQQDAEEYIFRLFNNMSEGLPGHPSFWDLRMIQALFGIDLQWHKKCSRCEEISLTGQTELMLHLNIGTRFYTQGKLESYIRRAMNDTVHDYKCENPNCIERRDKTVDFLAKKRKCYIIGAPDVLLISIQRFGLTGRKIMDTVVYPCILDLRPFMEPGAGSGSYQYELRAVLNHIGHHVDSGHYTTTARSEAKDTRGKARWFEANDSRITEKDLKYAMKPRGNFTPSVLVYNRADTVEFTLERDQHEMLDQSGKRSVPAKRKRV